MPRVPQRSTKTFSRSSAMSETVMAATASTKRVRLPEICI